MKIKTGSSIEKETLKAIEESVNSLGQISPNLLILSASCLYDFQKIQSFLTERFPSTPFQAATSCLGTMSDQGVHQNDGHGMSIFSIEDQEGNYGTGIADLAQSPYQAGIVAINKAIEEAGRDGESPDAIWLMSAPGSEESILEGVQSVVGSNVPIIGGSAGDNTIEGNWFLCTQKDAGKDYVTLAVFYTESLITTAFHSGYDSTSQAGVITKSTSRTIDEIDGRPAAEVYNQWSKGSISEYINSGGNILSTSGLGPIGRVVGSIQGVPYYKLSHPETVTENGGLTLFTDISEGDEIIFMKGSVEGIVDRAQNVFNAAINVEQLETEDICGVLSTFCAGCMLTIGGDVVTSNNKIQRLLKNKIPYISSFTFGEQGQFPGGENCHGNLMISVLVFTNKK
jgi:hypothetical protein